MSPLELIAKLREQGIRISAVDGELELDAPAGALTPELRAQIVARKPELLRLLSWSRRSSRAAEHELKPAAREGRLPLSWAQQRLWFLDQLEPGSSAYNISWTVRLTGDLHETALQAAFDQLLARHETLRTRFPVEEGVPFQQIDLPTSVTFLRETQFGVTDEKLRARLARLASMPFDLAAGPLLRVHLLRLSEDEHILLVLIHHIVADGASMRVLFRELAAYYEAELEGTHVELQPLPVQYADFAVWQREWLDGAELKRQTDYWAERLGGLPPLLELPWDRPRAAAMRYRGASVLRVLPLELADELRALARAQGCTLFMVMLSAFYVLLMRYSGRADLAVGTPLGGRPRSELEGLIGFFINTVVLRADLDGDPSFAALLQQVRDVALEAHANQELPFEKLVEVLQPERELSYSPVFQVMFDLQEEPRWRLPVRNLEVVPEVVFSSRTSSFDLTLSVRQADNGLDAMFEYDTDLFDETTIERFAVHYQQLLLDIVSNPERPLSELSLTDASSRQTQIDTWGTLQASYPDSSTLVDLFERQAEQVPDSVAVECDGSQCSYAELNRRANRLAYRLNSLGVATHTVVALAAPRSVNSVAAMLGILKSGATVMPLDPAYPQARRASMLEDAAPRLAIVAAADAGVGECMTLPLTDALFTDPDYPAANPMVNLDPADPAFLLYTSGSTGKPKGVELAHRGLVNYVAQLGEKTGLSSADRVLQFASTSFDISIEESFAALAHGGTLVLREDAMLDSIAAFTERCAALQISWLSLPTAWWHELCAELTTGLRLPSGLRCVVIGGERAQRGAFRQWCQAQSQTDPVRLINTYGPTETSIVATWCELTHLDPTASYELPIGHPVPNVRAWVLDELQRPLPVGVPGELYIGGVGVGLGYHGRAEQTAERFVTDVLSGEPGARLYRTGDRARYSADGQLVFMGRLDDQLKVRGHRIEPGEIEAAVLAVPGAERCAVLLKDERLVAYVVGDVSADTLRLALQDRLPEYMVPAAWVGLAELPLTPNGKLDVQALPAPLLQRADEAVYVAPRTELEQQVAAIWTDVLGVERVGIHDDFFALGGHSLLATRVVARIRDALGQGPALRSLFSHPTVAQLAELLATVEHVADSVPLQLRPADLELPPLSWAQQRLWFLDQLEPDTTAYSLPWTARLTGDLQHEALQAAVDALVQRHESLRTVFAVHEGQPVQLIAADSAVPVQTELLPGATHAELDQRLLELMSEPFNLHTGPLLRVHVLQVADDEAVLLLLMHHIVSDGWSMGVLFRELAALYDAAVQGVPANLPALTVQYADYAVWQQQWLSGAELQRQLSYWSAQLQAAPPVLELPLDHPRPPLQRYQGAWVNRSFSPELLASLRQLANAQGCTLFMVLLAAFKALAYRLTGSEDIVIGTPIAGRRRTELEGLIGFFLNTLALRTRLDGNPGFTELLQRVKATTLDAYDHQELPFEKLLETLQPERSTAHTPVVQVMFNLHNEPAAGLSLAGLRAAPFSIDRGTAKFDLSVAMVESDAGLQAGFEYNTDLFNPGTIEAWLDQYGRLLEELVARPDVRIAVVPLLDVPVPTAPEDCFGSVLAPTLTARFADIVARYPERAAVCAAGQTWSYAELDRRANAVAATLADATGQRIGVLLGHDIRMLAGIWGVLKAGCTYVPLNSAAPKARLQAVIDEAEFDIVVTDASAAAVLEDINGDDHALRVVEVGDAESDHAPDVNVEPDSLAYILFTSGSTGTPKGVMQTQRNVLEHARVYSNALQITPTDRLSLLAHYGFDAAVMDIFGALLNGACLCPVDLKAATRPAAELAAAEITLFHATPTVFRFLLEDEAIDWGSVRAVVLGGEEAQANDFALFRERFVRPAVFVNGLGPSESTLALQFRADHDTQLSGGVVPIGRPVAGTEVVLLQEGDGAALTEAGVSGELAVRSRCVSPGYWKLPELTAARFIPDPDEAGLVLYRTGDRARYLPDGQLAFVGRTDDQVKVRGHRIEPGEVEAAVAGVPGVQRCAVVLDQSAGQQRLVAYVVGRVAATELRSEAQARLPEYMVPSAFMPVDELPLTANGKLDKRALPAPVFAREAGDSFVAPRTDIEAQLVAIWTEVLGVERISVHDDFFALGGHSLMATRVVARVRDQLARSLSLRALFVHTSIAELAALLAASADETDQLPLARRPDTGELPPLSWAQQRLWFLDQLEPESAAYNLHWAATLDGHLKLEVLQQAVQQLVQRHEALRTRFVAYGGEPLQLIMPQLEVPVRVERLTGAAAPRVKARVLELIRQPFNLQQGPLLRVHVLQVADDEAVLLLVMHHIVSDGWSMGVLFRELALLYDAAVQGAVARLPELPVQYADYAVWQQQWLSGAELDRQLNYWAGQLRDAPPLLELPLDHLRPPVQRYRGAWVHQTFSPELLAGLHELAAREGCTLFMVLLAAFKLLVARHTGIEDIVIGTPIAGRRRTELEGLIGFFLNTLALRTRLDGNPDFRALLQRVKATTLDAYDHQELPFEKLLEALQPERSTAHTPVVQVMFNLHNEPSSGLSLAGVAVSPFSVDRGTAKFDLSVALVEGAAGLQAGFEYNTDLFERETVELLLRHFGELLWAIARNPEQPIAGYSLTSAATELGHAARRAPADTALAGDVVAAFERNVQRRPEQPAVVCGDIAWTYLELHERANAVAQALAGEAGTRVGVLLGHDPRMLAGLLGTLKAGCTYVPLDRDAPPARLQAVINEAELELVISDADSCAALDGCQGVRMVAVGDEREPAAPAVTIDPDALAYILFTSGSTGKPKGVTQTQRNLLHHAVTYIESLGVSDTDRLTLLSHYGFDAAVMDIFGALISGACLYPMSLREENYTGELLDRMGEQRITVLHATPTVFRHLMRNKVCRHDLTCVRFVVLGGEETLANDFALFRKQFAPPTLFVNGLGPSESTLALQFFAGHSTRLPGNVVPVGTPVDGTEVLLLNEDGTEAGISGELALRSRHVSPGYWKLPGLSAERFLPDPAEPGVVLYRTGDRARYLPDGRLVFMGRVDDQVKVRGHRIEPGEIEAAALTVAGVERCAVVLIDDRLVAYVVGQLESAVLRAALLEQLPEYMVPAAYVLLDELPLTPNGKLDKKALPAPALTRDEREEYVAPRTDVEKHLVTIWSAVLGVDRIGVHDDFFALGGHSLMAAQLVARVTDSLQVGLPIRRLFDTPTVAGIAEHVETLQWALRGDAD